MFTRNTVVFAKIETEYGIDPIPNPASNAIAVRDLVISPAGEAVERNILRGSLSQLSFLRGTSRVEVDFKTEMKGTGTKGAIPAFGWEGDLFRACGMSQTANAGTDLLYTPISENFESCTLYVYIDRLFHKLTGCRGSFRISIEVGKPAMVEWKFKGFYSSPSDASPSAQTFSGILPPVALGADFSIGGYGPVSEKFEVDINNSVVERKSIAALDGVIGFEITGRKPRGSFDPETVAVTTHPFWSNWQSATPLRLNLAIGSADGNRFAIEAPAIQYSDMGSGDRDGRVVYKAAFSLAMSNGDDELLIRFS